MAATGQRPIRQVTLAKRGDLFPTPLSLLTARMAQASGDGYPILEKENGYVDTDLTIDHLFIMYFAKQKQNQIPELKKRFKE